MRLHAPLLSLSSSSRTQAILQPSLSSGYGSFVPTLSLRLFGYQPPELAAHVDVIISKLKIPFVWSGKLNFGYYQLYFFFVIVVVFE